jgi:hypothetical protein
MFTLYLSSFNLPVPQTSCFNILQRHESSKIHSTDSLSSYAIFYLENNRTKALEEIGRTVNTLK